MTKNQIKFLDLFYNEGDGICVSDGKCSFKSITRDEIESEEIELHSPPSKKNPNGFIKHIQSKDIVLSCINPVNGRKMDRNITSFRGFLIELDDMELKDQKKYIDESGLPHSICVYSGNKSLHYGIVLDEDLPNRKTWDLFARWMTNILDKADEQNVTPSRGFRFPDNIRPDGLQKKQNLIKMGSRITIDEFYEWLQKHPEKRPKPVAPQYQNTNLEPIISPYSLPTSILDKLLRLRHGEQEYRNKSWFGIACFMAKKGVSLENAFGLLGNYFVEEADFDRNEWVQAIRSGYSYVQRIDNV